MTGCFAYLLSDIHERHRLPCFGTVNKKKSVRAVRSGGVTHRGTNVLPFQWSRRLVAESTWMVFVVYSFVLFESCQVVIGDLM